MADGLGLGDLIPDLRVVVPDTFIVTRINEPFSTSAELELRNVNDVRILSTT
jgi:hypothetical protein